MIFELASLIIKLESDATNGWGSHAWRNIKWIFKEKGIRMMREESAKNTMGLKLQNTI